MKPLEQRFLDVLKPGYENIQSSYTFAQKLDVPQRSIGFLVSDLRKQGYLIGSEHGLGYFSIETEQELDSTIKHIASRKAGIDATIAALKTSWSEK